MLIHKIVRTVLKYRLHNINFKEFATKNMNIKTVLIDLSGTLHVEDEPTENAVDALKRLRETGVKIKFVTNTTKESSDTLYNRLKKIGFDLEKPEIYSSLSAAVNYIKENKLNPYYFLSSDAQQDFPPTDENCNCDSIVIGLAPESFNYENMNRAFNILLENKNVKLIAIHQGKYYRTDKGLALGPGCFVKGLEYAASTTAIVIGKPNKYFFENAIPSDCKPEECVMIGDDANDDILGAMKIGMKGIQVKTGKWRSDVIIDPPATIVLDNFDKAVKWIEENRN